MFFLDVDECLTKQDLCDGDAYCVVYPNSISYSCQCKDGYQGDGFQCSKLPGNWKYFFTVSSMNSNKQIYFQYVFWIFKPVEIIYPIFKF